MLIHRFLDYLLRAIMAGAGAYIAYYILRFVWETFAAALEYFGGVSPESGRFLMFLLAIVILVATYVVHGVFIDEKSS